MCGMGGVGCVGCVGCVCVCVCVCVGEGGERWGDERRRNKREERRVK